MSEEVIKFESLHEGENGVKLVSARELHEQLEVSERFAQWFNKRVEKYDFIEGEDFIGCKTFNTLAKQELQDYAITLGMAKELCMVQNNNMGKKCRRYFINLEKENKQLKQDNEQLYEIAVSPEEQAVRQWEADKVKYKFSNIGKLLKGCDYTNLMSTIDKIIEVHSKLKVNERQEAHQDTSRYGDAKDTIYIKHVKEHIVKKLNAMDNGSIDSILAMVVKDAKYLLTKELKSSNNRSNAQVIRHKDSKIKTLEQHIVKLNNYLDCYVPEQEKFIKLNYRPFTYNKMYEGSDENKVRTKYYDRWIYRFPKVEEVTKEFWEEQGVDFSKRTILHLMFIAPKHCDNDNMIKSIQDQLFVRNFGMDDCDVQIGGAYKIGECDKMREGKIYFYINNELEEEEAM